LDIDIEHVTKRFGEVTAVEDICLQIEQGEFLTLLGPSGCGKTTLLRLIAGFEQPTTGQIRLEGKDVGNLPPHHRNVCTVFQHYALFPHLNVFDNVAFGLERKKIPKQEVQRKIAEALALVQLEGLETRMPQQLSGGQQQRVALARALVLEPRALLLDEPLGALDLKLRKEMQVELKRLQRRLGITFLFVTHDQEEALTMSDRIAVMRQGRIEQLGTPEEVYERPRTEFVADFIGVSNIFTAEVISTDTHTVVAQLYGRTLRWPRPPSFSGSAVVRFTVRPEKIKLMSEPGPERVPGIVEERLYLGDSTHWRVRLGDGQIVTVFEQNRSADGRPLYDVGRKVFLHWDESSAVLLDG
jgi:spermidine/putrescine transport system ATP-binding protein